MGNTKFYFEEQGNIVMIRIQSDVSVNAWTGSVLIPQEIKINKIITKPSITEIWQKIPEFQNNQIDFVGGKPNGFEGDGIIFKIILEGNGKLQFSSITAAYLNDGAGSNALVLRESLDYSLKNNSFIGIVDNTAPQAFSPQFFQDINFFDNKPVVIFETEDNESGISYYEIKEITGSGIIDWHAAESPYVLNEGVKEIQIKAVDNFGNERIETFNAEKTNLSSESVLLFVLVIAIIAVAYIIILKWRKKRSLKLF
ncbi:MAG: hypothetical protein QMD65_02265 [Patescibacteria group bacterium]|nr:hypothetical protein [Patescibacteria group bacterium]